MSAYRAGARAEYLLKARLEAQGYVTLRSAGSHGPFDLTAIKKGHVRFIQVKFTSRGFKAAAAHLRKFRAHPPLPNAPGVYTQEMWVLSGGKWWSAKSDDYVWGG